MAFRIVSGCLLACLAVENARAAVPAPFWMRFGTSLPVQSAQVGPSETEAAQYGGPPGVVVSGDMVQLTQVIAEGIDLNRRDAHGRTALMIAVYRKNRQAFTALVDAGADINALDVQRYDILTIAAVADDLWGVKQAIAAGADVNLADSSGISPLTLAERAGYGKIIAI